MRQIRIKEANLSFSGLQTSCTLHCLHCRTGWSFTGGFVLQSCHQQFNSLRTQNDFFVWHVISVLFDLSCALYAFEFVYHRDQQNCLLLLKSPQKYDWICCSNTLSLSTPYLVENYVGSLSSFLQTVEKTFYYPESELFHSNKKCLLL